MRYILYKHQHMCLLQLTILGFQVNFEFGYLITPFLIIRMCCGYTTLFGLVLFVTSQITTVCSHPIGLKQQQFRSQSLYKQNYIGMTGNPVTAAPKVFIHAEPQKRIAAVLNMLRSNKDLQGPGQKIKVTYKSAVGPATSFISFRKHYSGRSDVFGELSIGNSQLTTINNSTNSQHQEKTDNSDDNIYGEPVGNDNDKPLLDKNGIDRYQIKSVQWYSPKSQQIKNLGQTLNHYGLSNPQHDDKYEQKQYFAKVASIVPKPQQNASVNKENKKYQLPTAIENLGYQQPIVMGNHGYQQPVIAKNHSYQVPIVIRNHEYQHTVIAENHESQQFNGMGNYGYQQPNVVRNLGYQQQNVMENLGYQKPVIAENQEYMKPTVMVNHGYQKPVIQENQRYQQPTDNGNQQHKAAETYEHQKQIVSENRRYQHAVVTEKYENQQPITTYQETTTSSYMSQLNGTQNGERSASSTGQNGVQSSFTSNSQLSIVPVIYSHRQALLNLHSRLTIGHHSNMTGQTGNVMYDNGKNLQPTQPHKDI